MTEKLVSMARGPLARHLAVTTSSTSERCNDTRAEKQQQEEQRRVFQK